MPNYKEVDGVRYQVVNNTFLGSNLIPVDAGGSLPEVDGSDNGKVLTVVAGEWDAAAVPKELPSVAGNAGKVLTVNSGATGTEWKNAPSGLPAVTIDDAGDVLTVNASGEWEAAAPGGGGGLTLYGPYYASNSSNRTVTNNVTPIILDAIYDDSSNQVQLPDSSCIIIPSNVQCPATVRFCGFDSPMFSGSIWTDFAVYAVSDDNSVTVPPSYCTAAFYASVILPAYDSGGGDFS